MFELKPLSQQAIPDALKKAERYRFLNEPRQAESICPGHPERGCRRLRKLHQIPTTAKPCARKRSALTTLR